MKISPSVFEQEDIHDIFDAIADQVHDNNTMFFLRKWLGCGVLGWKKA